MGQQIKRVFFTGPLLANDGKGVGSTHLDEDLPGPRTQAVVVEKELVVEFGQAPPFHGGDVLGRESADALPRAHGKGACESSKWTAARPFWSTWNA